MEIEYKYKIKDKVYFIDNYNDFKEGVIDSITIEENGFFYNIGVYDSRRNGNYNISRFEEDIEYDKNLVLELWKTKKTEIFNKSLDSEYKQLSKKLENGN